MNRATNVLAVVVTYNRLQLLQRCVAHLISQELLPDILVINNSSPDDTENWLKETGIDFITQANGGSSAGWKTGIDEALKRGYEHVWLMDDDGFADTKALKTLLANVHPQTALISSIVVKENDPKSFVFGLPVVDETQQPVLFAGKRKYQNFAELPQRFGSQYPFAHLFNGALLNLELAKKVGTVNTDYFIYGDEVDYYCRLLKAGRVHYQLDALHYHPDVGQRVIEKSRVYYYIRNTIILNNKYFNRSAIRNVLTVGVALFRLARRNGISAAMKYVFGEDGKYVWKAIQDGR
ncbi:MAG: glycosyltransferase, partial [Bacteroidetes bacterium]|nr:glycosyltransferase [Bacteroidota bacterium]